MAFLRKATLNIKSVYAADNDGKFQWRDFVKQANENPSNDRTKFLPQEAYNYDTKNFLFLTARAISGMEKHGYNGNYDAFPWEEIKKALPTYPGVGFYIEHKEDSEADAKGIVLDAVPNDEEEYVVCLCAIDKNEYPEFCQQILDGTYNQVSMSCLASTCECLTPGTHILTPEGQTKIQDIKVGDYVLTHKGRFRKVLETFKNPMPEYTYKIYFESGRENQVVNDSNRYNGTWIRATGNHPIYMADGTWKNAEDIKEGDLVKCLTKKCPVCGKDVVYSKTQKYCSASCQSKDINNRYEVREKRVSSLKETVKNRTEEDKKILHNILSKGQKKFQQSENYEKRKEEMAKLCSKTLNKFFNSDKSKTEKQRRADWLKNAWQKPEYREKMIENSRKVMKKLAHKKRSFLEEKFEGFLIREGLKKGIDYKTNDFLYVNELRTYPDFKFENQKLIVEIDGEYWHNNPEAIKKDTYKNKIWEENGWTVIRYTGKQVNNEFDKVKDSFKRIYKNHNHEYTFGDFKVLKVEKIKTTPKCHNVYNLHVEEDESYIAENLVVHNCSKCHNVATSFDNLCEHMNPNNPITYMKGKQDENGNYVYEINKDICFTGLSAVEVPADKDAFVFDIKASKKKSNVKEEFAKYTQLKQAGKMKEFKMACEEQFKALSNVDLLNKMKILADSLLTTIMGVDNTQIITTPLQGIVRELMQLQIGLNIMDLQKLDNTPIEPAKEEGGQEPLTMIEDEAENFGEKEVNLDKEIDSYLDGDNYSYTPFSSTAKVKKQAGTWAIPDTKEKVQKLKNILKEPLPASKTHNKIDGLIGDDELSDEIDDYLETEPNEAMNNVIKYHLKRIQKCPLNRKSYNTEEEYKEALESQKLWHIILEDY